MKGEITVKDVEYFPVQGGIIVIKDVENPPPRCKGVIVIKDEEILCGSEEYLR